MNEMLTALGYKIAIIPVDAPITEDGFIVGGKEEENAWCSYAAVHLRDGEIGKIPLVLLQGHVGVL